MDVTLVLFQIFSEFCQCYILSSCHILTIRNIKTVGIRYSYGHLLALKNDSQVVFAMIFLVSNFHNNIRKGIKVLWNNVHDISIVSLNSDICLFADHTALLCTGPDNIMQSHLDEILEWTENNTLTIIVKTTKYMSICT